MTETPPPRPSEDEIRQWIVDRLARELKIKPKRFSLNDPIEEQGVDSMQFVMLVGELEEWLGVEFTDNPLVRYSSVNEFASFLAEELAAGRTVINPDQGAR